MANLLFIPVGGLGHSQLGEITTAVKTLHGVLIASTPSQDGWKGEGIWDNVFANPSTPIFVVGHSMGGPTARHFSNIALDKNLSVTGLVLLDNVEYFTPDPLISQCPNTKVFIAGNSFPFTPREVSNFPSEQVPATTHNTLCQSSRVVNDILFRVRKILTGDK